MNLSRPKSMGVAFGGVFVPVFTGLALSQFVATIIVHLSNQRILALANALKNEGYLSIPTGPAKETLSQFGAAAAGGVFFTLSIGTGLTLVTWAATWLWCRFLRGNRTFVNFTGVGIVWAGLLIAINLDGFSWLPTIFGIVIPPVTVWATLLWLPQTKMSKNMFWTVPLATLVILTAIWATQLKPGLFISIRDHVLLSNPIGNKINDFYYRNTLYAAEVFKSFNQKTIRTYRWEGGADTALENQLEKSLSRYDVLRLKQDMTTDMVLAHRGGRLHMTAPDGRQLETTPEEFTAALPEWLNRYSELTDRWGPFRRTILFGLLIGFPILLFIAVYGALRMAVGLLMNEKQAVCAASGICLAIGILLFLPMRNVTGVEITQVNLASALSSNAWPQRVAALRYIEAQKLEISRYPQFKSLVASPLVVERYWLARAMASSRTQATYSHLTSLLKDPHPNVVCQTYYALGQRRMRGAIAPILEQVKTSDHWYTQWYAYRALRRLGWSQIRSN